MRILIGQTIKVTIILFFLVCFVHAEHYTHTFLQTQWTTEEGLPQNSVLAVAQTPDGYLWLGTFGGLVRFDGVRFKTYSTATTPELKSNRITSVITDSTGTLWIGTERGELTIYMDGRFYLLDDGSKIKNNIITDLFADTKGVIWSGSTNGLQKCSLTGCQNAGFQSPVEVVQMDSAGFLWVLSQGQLIRLEGENFTQSKVVLDKIKNFEVTPKGEIWIVKDGELGLFQNSIYQQIHKFAPSRGSSDFFLSTDGKLWLSFGENLLEIMDGQVVSHLIEGVRPETSENIFVDREGSLWLGRRGEGLIRLLKRRVQTLIGDDGFPLNIAANSIAEDKQGNIWISTNRGLVVHWQDERGTEVIKADSVSSQIVEGGALLFDSQGTLWNNTTKGLFQYKEGRLLSRDDIPVPDSPSGNSLFEDSQKNLWAGGQNYGVYKIVNEKIVEHFTTENGLAGNFVVFIKETRDGAIWFGTTSGLSRLKDGVFTNYTGENGLLNEYIRDLYEDQDGTLWVGTYGGGLYRFREGKFTPITSKDGLFDDAVSQILVDDGDNFWMLGNRGVFVVNRQMLNDFADKKIKQIYCGSYTVADGMIISEGNGGYQNSAIRSRSGRFWFSMLNGAVIIDPKGESLPTPQPQIEEVLMEKELVSFIEKLELDSNHEDLEIHYTGISFIKPQQIIFRYKMEGLDDDWEEVGTRRIAYYPRLSFGNYHFKVIASNGDGNWSKEIADLEITVSPPFYRTWWFFILMWLVFFIVLIFAYRYRAWKFKRDTLLREDFARRLINAQETERRKIAADIHDQLGQQLLIIKNWAAFCLSKTSRTSKIRDQIIQINETADEALNEVRSMAKTLSPYHLDKAGLTKTIHFMVKQIAESSAIEFTTKIDNIDNILSKENELNLYRIVQESANNIVKHSNARKAGITIKREGKELKLTITDNGQGFYIGESDYQEFGTGLNSMIERARMLRGELTINSIPQNGTQIYLFMTISD